MSHLLDGILRLSPGIALLLVFALPALEASAFLGVVVPGEICVILGGVLANQHKLPLATVLAAAIAGAILGDSFGYLVGKRYGAQLLAKLPRRLVKPEHVRRTEVTIREAGRESRTHRPFHRRATGSGTRHGWHGRMPYRQFLPWNVFGGTSWAATFVVLGSSAAASTSASRSTPTTSGSVFSP